MGGKGLDFLKIVHLCWVVIFLCGFSKLFFHIFFPKSCLGNITFRYMFLKVCCLKDLKMVELGMLLQLLCRHSPLPLHAFPLSFCPLY